MLQWGTKSCVWWWALTQPLIHNMSYTSSRPGDEDLADCRWSRHLTDCTSLPATHNCAAGCPGELSLSFPTFFISHLCHVINWSDAGTISGLAARPAVGGEAPDGTSHRDRNRVCACRTRSCSQRPCSQHGSNLWTGSSHHLRYDCIGFPRRHW